MKKVVLVSDGRNFSDKTFEYVRSLYEKEPFLLTGAFFHSIIYDLLIPTTFAASAGPYLAVKQDEKDDYKKGITKFENLCLRHNIEFVIHKESEEWTIDDVVKESRFADVLVVSGELFFADIEKKQPNRFLRDVLVSAECPVLVVPEESKTIKRVGIAYDGKKESMFALKMFSYTFPSLTDLPVNIYYWVHKTDEDIPDFQLVQEFAGRHFPDLNFKELFFDQERYLGEWASDYQDTLFVCGSYHRSGIFSSFRKSFAEDIIKKHAAAVFIAHAP